MADPRLPTPLPPPPGALGSQFSGAPGSQLPPLPPGAVLVPPEGEQKPQQQQMPPLPPGATLVDEKGEQKPPGEKERGLNLDLLSETASNLIPSFTKNVGQTVEGLTNIVKHPVDTAVTLGKLATSVTPLGMALTAMQPIVNRVWGPEKAKGFNEMMASLDAPKQALIKDYMEAYGGGQQFLKTLGTDPFRILTDLATIASGGELAAATLPGKVGTTVRAVSKAAQLGDPVNLAMKGATGAGKVALGALDATTGAGQGVMMDALKFGFQGGEAGELFRKGIKETDPGVVAQIAREGIDTWKQRMSMDFQADKDVWSRSNARLDFTPMRRAQMDIENSMYSQTGQNRKLVISQGDKAKIDKAMAVIEEWRNDPSSHTVLGMDDLKKAIRNQIDWKTDSSVVTSALTKLSNSAKDIAMTAADPKYRTSLKRFGEASEQLEEVEKALALGDKAALHTTLTRLQKTVRNNANTQYGLQKDLASRLETEGGKQFMPMLSGQALSSWAPRGIGRGVASGMMPTLGAAGMFFNPLSILGGIGGAAATSPRLMGNIVHGAGRAAGAIPETVRGTFGKFMSQPMRNAYANYDRMANDNPFGGYRRGGRAGYAYGGRARLAEGGDPELAMAQAAAGASPMAGLSGPYSGIGLGSIAQSARRRMGAVAPQKPVQVKPPEVEPLRFAKEVSNPTADLLKQFQDATKQPEEKDDSNQRLAEALAAAQAQNKAAPSTDAAAQAKVQPGPTGGGGGGGGDPLDVAEKTQGDFTAKTTAVESGGKLDAKNSLGMMGLFQFAPATLQGIIQRHPELGITMEGFLKDEAMQRRAMKALTDENAAAVRAKVGRDPTGGELYLAHFLGAGGASALLSNPDRPLVEIVGQKVIDANPWVGKYKTGRELLNRTNRSFA